MCYAGQSFFTFLAVITTIVFGIILYSRVNEVESSIVHCKVDGCTKEARPGTEYCADHGCNWPSCTNPRAKGSLYCSTHREKYEINDSSSAYKSSSSQKSYSNYNTTYKDSSKKSSSSSRSNTQTKTYGSSKYSKSKNVDTYGVNDYSDADSFADDYYEEFYDYEDDYEDEDEAYDAAVDYWEDNYDGDDELKKAYSEMLEGCLAHQDQWDWYAMWIIEMTDGTHIGDLCFKGLENKNPEIGYGILDEFQGNGYATEAVKLAVKWALDHPEVEAVEAETDSENVASQKVLMKCGFEANGEIGEEGPRYIICRE